MVFQDISELILSSGSGAVTFITSKGEVRNSPLFHDLEKKDPSLFKRLNYAKEILMHMINPKSSGKNDNEKENLVHRDGPATSRAKDAQIFSKLGLNPQAPKSAFETSGLVTTRNKPHLKF